MVTFPDEIHPKFGLKLRWDYSPRAEQYLSFFKIIQHYPTIKYVPLDLTFETYEELSAFLTKNGIIYEEVEIHQTSHKVVKTYTLVDASKIYEFKESFTKYLLDFRYYSINDLAEILSFSRPTIYKIIKEGKIKTIRINAQMRVKHADLMLYINSENQK